MTTVFHSHSSRATGALTGLALALSFSAPALAQAPAQPQYPQPQYPQQQYPQQPAPQYPQQPPPGYPQGQPANPQQPAPQYPQQPPAGYPQQPPPGYPQQPAPQYPPPGYPQQPPPGYPQQPGYPPAGQPSAAGYPPGAYGANAGMYAAAEDPGSHRHDGFYLKIMLGPGYTVFNGENDSSIKGLGYGLSLDVGGAVSENVIIFGQFQSNTITNPTVSNGRVSVKNDDLDFSTNGLGVGAAYYIMPVNAFVSGALLFASHQVRSEATDDSESDGKGLALNLSAGKEFWVSTNWGLGIAGQVMLARVIEDGDAKFTDLGFSLGMTGAFN